MTIKQGPAEAEWNATIFPLSKHFFDRKRKEPVLIVPVSCPWCFKIANERFDGISFQIIFVWIWLLFRDYD